MDNAINENNIDKSHLWIIQLFLAALVVSFFVFMEWLFFVTKPSFMSALTFPGTLQVLLTSPLPLAIFAAAIISLLWLTTRIISNNAFYSACSVIAQIAVAAILASSLFLLIDNFTYTLFRFGVVSTAGFLIWVYRILLLILVILVYRFLHGLRIKLAKPGTIRKFAIIVSCIALISILVTIVTYKPSNVSLDRNIRSLKSRPNIIILSSDGLNATNLSVYGYSRDTTPFLKELSRNALLCENCFTNSGVSGASIASMLTGKLPTQTRVIYPPYFLKGVAAYQHLPGILKKYGYRNIDISIRYHADALDMNMLCSFDWANFREIKETIFSKYLGYILNDESSYLLSRMSGRLKERLLHIYGKTKMTHALGEVETPAKKFNKDADRIEFLISAINTSPTPFFAHIHLLGTHGPTYTPSNTVFSMGRKQKVRWAKDWYDDSILDFDDQVRQVVQALSDRKILDNTVLVICSDHGQRFTVNERLPLIFIFPHGEHSKRISSNVQNLDVAPTLLDYLNIEQPEWMGGLSLLPNEIDPARMIITVDPKHGTLQSSKSNFGPPFYSLVTVGVFYHHKYFELNVRESTLTISNIEEHTSPCSKEEIPDPEQIGQLLIDHLKENNYDTSSIKTPLTITRSRSRRR
jgi:hypothetical protein